MKRMDQYIEELKKEKVEIQLYFDNNEKVFSTLEGVTAIEELFHQQCNNNDDNKKNKSIQIVLMAQYQKKKLLQENDNNITEENKKLFLKCINVHPC